MTKLIVSSLVTLIATAALAAAPALAQPETKTELVALDGKSVDIMQLRYDFDSAWVVDSQTILYRDLFRAYYLVKTKAACEQLTIKGRAFSFHPSWSWRLLSSNAYEVRPEAGPRCDVARIEQVDDTRADPLRDAALWRVW
jgi:hypothetical protein